MLCPACVNDALPVPSSSSNPKRDAPGVGPGIHQDPSSTSSSMIINLKTAKALGLAIPPSVVRHVGSATIALGF
jgi:hypothetical protein